MNSRLLILALCGFVTIPTVYAQTSAPSSNESDQQLEEVVKGSENNPKNSSNFTPAIKKVSTPLIKAVLKNDKDKVISLLAQGADVNATDEGISALFYATIKGNKEIAQLLIKAGADVNAVVPDSGLTPLHSAIMRGKSDLIQLLLQNGARPEIKNGENADAFALIKQYNKSGLSKEKLQELAIKR